MEDNLIKKDILLKSLLFSMLFYIMMSPVITHYVGKITFITDLSITKSIIFGLSFYLISILI